MIVLMQNGAESRKHPEVTPVGGRAAGEGGRPDSVPSHQVEGALHGGHRPQGTEMAGGESFRFGGAGSEEPGSFQKRKCTWQVQSSESGLRAGDAGLERSRGEGPGGRGPSRAHPRLLPILACPRATHVGPHPPAPEGQSQVRTRHQITTCN